MSHGLTDRPSFLNKIDGSPATSVPDPSTLTKGEASDAIQQGLDAAKQASSRGSGAAEDTTPGEKKPTGPSAKQPATNNQKVRRSRPRRSDTHAGLCAAARCNLAGWRDEGRGERRDRAGATEAVDT